MEGRRLTVGYNFQGDNKALGKFNGWVQCMTTCAWMLICYYTATYKANDDNMLFKYLDDVEANGGNPGIGEWVKNKYRWITGNTSQWWLTQKHGIEKWLWHVGVKGEAKFYNKTMTIDFMKNVLDTAPVIIGTHKIGGLPGGHIILCVGVADNGDIVCHDPAGNALENYKSGTGDFVEYPVEYLEKFTGKKFYALHWM